MSTGRKFWFLTATQIERLHRTYITSPATVLQPAYLQSAAYGPINAKYYGQQQDVFELAANLSEKIMKNHAFMDGNKRTAMVAADAFLKMNGFKLQTVPMASTELNNTALIQAHLAVVTNQWTANQLADFYRRTATSCDLSTEFADWRKEAEEH